MTAADPTTPPTADEPSRAPLLRPRTLATQLFADALHGDHAATDRLRRLAVADDPDAIAAFTAIAVTELDRHEPPALPMHRLDQLLAAVHEATACRAAAADGDGGPRRSRSTHYPEARARVADPADKRNEVER